VRKSTRKPARKSVRGGGIKTELVSLIKRHTNMEKKTKVADEIFSMTNEINELTQKINMIKDSERKTQLVNNLKQLNKDRNILYEKLYQLHPITKKYV
jgi:uncharacterized coiled-coil DUF342 family protein